LVRRLLPLRRRPSAPETLRRFFAHILFFRSAEVRIHLRKNIWPAASSFHKCETADWYK